MITEQPVKLKRGPRPGTHNFISVPLVSLIKLCAASATIPVNRKWAESQGYVPNMEIPSLSEVIGSKVVSILVPEPVQVIQKQEVSPQESSNLRLEVREIGEEDFD